jgi:hypothetical protein
LVEAGEGDEIEKGWLFGRHILMILSLHTRVPVPQTSFHAVARLKRLPKYLVQVML